MNDDKSLTDDDLDALNRMSDDMLDATHVPQLPSLARQRAMCSCCSSVTMVREHTVPEQLLSFDRNYEPYLLCDVCVSIGADRASLPLLYTPRDENGTITGATVLRDEPDARMLRAIAYGINVQLESANLVGVELDALRRRQEIFGRQLRDINRQMEDMFDRAHKQQGAVLQNTRDTYKQVVYGTDLLRDDMKRLESTLTQQLDEIQEAEPDTGPSRFVFDGISDAGAQSLVGVLRLLDTAVAGGTS